MRAQAAVEFFLAMSIGLLVLYWYSNYLTAFGESTKATGVNSQQKLLTLDLVKSANEVCVRATNLTVNVPCLMEGYDNLPYAVDVFTDPPTAAPILLATYNSYTNGNQSARTLCPLVDDLPGYVQCSPLARLCFSKDNASATGQVHFRLGSCG